MRELAPSGDLSTSKTYPFDFRNVEMQYDSYRGQQVRCRCVQALAPAHKRMLSRCKCACASHEGHESACHHTG